MGTYVLRRLLVMIPVLFIISVMVFSMVHLSPGDPVMLLVPEEDGVDQETIDAIRRAHGLDRPVPIQYLSWVGGVLTGDLGRSIRTNQPVLEAIMSRFPVTLHLAVMSVVLALVLGIPLGAVAAIKRNSPIDSSATMVSLVGIALPNMFLGIVLIYVFALLLGLLPPSGYTAFTNDPIRSTVSLLLPAVTMGTALMASIMRMMRSSLLEVLRRDYVTTARAKGLAEQRVFFRHAFRNALMPVTTITGLHVAGLLGGTFIVEEIFALPGVGRLAVSAIYARDFPVVQGVVLLFAILFLFVNLAVDLLYAFLDPRIRYS
jgi:peptide/nickel transport system permease protein